MTTDIPSPNDYGDAIGNASQIPQRQPDPKWAALINDQLFPMPRRNLMAKDILDQSGQAPEAKLIRDHGGTWDILFQEHDEVDLADGNVFRASKHCDLPGKSKADAPAKLAFVCNDHWELTLIPRQTVNSLKRLLGVRENEDLFRDLESPHDQKLESEEVVHFSDGPVFLTRGCEPKPECKIIVNGRERTVTAVDISYEEVVILAFANCDPKTIYTVSYTRGVPEKPEGSMVRGDRVKINCGMIFNVTATTKS